MTIFELLILEQPEARSRPENGTICAVTVYYGSDPFDLAQPIRPCQHRLLQGGILFGCIWPALITKIENHEFQGRAANMTNHRSF